MALMLSLLKERVAATLGAVTANSEQDVRAPDQIIHGCRHIDRTARGAKDCPAVLVNVINEGRRQHCRFLAARRIKTVITASVKKTICLAARPAQTAPLPARVPPDRARSRPGFVPGR